MSRTTGEQKGRPSSLARIPRGRGHRHLLPQPPHPQSHRQPSGCSSLAVHTPPPGHLALPHLLLKVCCCASHHAILPHTCARGQTLGQSRHRDPTAAENLPGPHRPPHAHPSSGEACLPLPPTSCPDAVRLFPADTLRGTGLPAEWEAHQWAGSPSTDFSTLSLPHNEHLGHFGCVCVQKVSSGEERKRWKKKAKITQK